MSNVIGLLRTFLHQPWVRCHLEFNASFPFGQWFPQRGNRIRFYLKLHPHTSVNCFSLLKVCSTPITVHTSSGFFTANKWSTTVFCVLSLSNYRLGRVNALGEPLPTKASSLKRPARLRPDLANKDDHQPILPDRKIVVEPLEWWVRAFYVGQILKCRHVSGLS